MSAPPILEWSAAPLWPWLLAAPSVALVGLWALARRRRERRLLCDERLESRLLPGFQSGRARLRLLCSTLGILCVVLALLGPVRGYTLRAVRTQGLDLVLCIDSSRSMLARDLRPDRLTRAKREAAGLIESLSGDRAALIAFSGEARDVAPLTRDKSTLLALLETISPEDNRLGGTDLAAAIQRALQYFDGRTGANEAIVLLTDGEDLAGSARAAAATAAERNIRIYVVGVGTAEGGKIPVSSGTKGGREYFLLDQQGNEVLTRLEGETLRALAQASGGEYLSAEDSPTPLLELYEKRIAHLDRRALEGGVLRVPHDRYQWPLGLGLLLLCLGAGLRDRRAPEQARA